MGLGETDSERGEKNCGKLCGCQVNVGLRGEENNKIMMTAYDIEDTITK